MIVGMRCINFDCIIQYTTMKNLLALVAFVCFVSVGAQAQTEKETESVTKTEQVIKADAANEAAPKKKSCCASKAKGKGCGMSAASAGAEKSEMKACCAAKAKEGKACCSTKTAASELKTHVCTEACTKEAHKYMCGEKGHTCSPDCKAASL
jgi:hypothetical protein